MANRGLGLGPFDAWTALFAQTRFAIDCQAVITMRMMRMAGGGEVAVREAVRMVTEKMETFAARRWRRWPRCRGMDCTAPRPPPSSTIAARCRATGAGCRVAEAAGPGKPPFAASAPLRA